MKNRYWGFNFEQFNQFGYFWKNKKGWHYFGIPFPFSLLAITLFMFADKDYVICWSKDENNTRSAI